MVPPPAIVMAMVDVFTNYHIITVTDDNLR
jgi:hypothetical protein